MKTLSQITYTVQSGAILPELHYTETYVITRTSVNFTRKGNGVETSVNTGNWEIPVDEEKISGLFSQLRKVNCKNIERVEAKDTPDGASTSSYVLFGRKVALCSLYYDPGTSYTHSELVVDPIQAFLKEITLPYEALNQFNP